VKRRLATLAAAVSLLLCIATAALWVRSYFRGARAFAGESLAYVNDIDDGTGQFIGRGDYPNRPSWSHAMWHDEWRITSAHGSICLYHDRSDMSWRGGARRTTGWQFERDPHWSVLFRQQRTGFLAWLGVSYSSVGFSQTDLGQQFPHWGYQTMLTFPHWMLLLATAVPASYSVCRFLLRCRVRRTGQCVDCGYDLRATPERCPECGAAAAATAAR
jgi:hypothetical protein